MAKKEDGHFNEKWNDAMIYQIAADKAQGMTIKQLAAKYKMTQQQVKYVVYRRLKNENIERGLPITNVALKEAGVADAKPKTKTKTESVTITVTSAGMAAPNPVPSAEKTTVTTAVDQGVFDKKEEPVHRGLWPTLWHKLFG
jgi:acetyl-CoA acetyltransferase